MEGNQHTKYHLEKDKPKVNPPGFVMIRSAAHKNQLPTLHKILGWEFFSEVIQTGMKSKRKANKSGESSPFPNAKTSTHRKVKISSSNKR